MVIEITFPLSLFCLKFRNINTAQQYLTKTIERGTCDPKKIMNDVIKLISISSTHTKSNMYLTIAFKNNSTISLLVQF